MSRSSLARRVAAWSFVVGAAASLFLLVDPPAPSGEKPVGLLARSPYTPPMLGPPPRLEVPRPEPEAGYSQWADLAGHPWQRATTGWQVLADQDLPVMNSSFTYGAMVVAGERFRAGLATYPFSEIVYDFGGRAGRFRSRVGVTDDARRGSGSVRFAVYGDEFLLYESGVVRAGDPAGEVDVGLEGLRELRLVVDDAGDGSLGDYALWAEPQVLLLAQPQGPSPSVEGARAGELAAEAASLGAAREALAAQAAADVEALRRVGALGARGDGGFDAPSALLALGNGRVGITLGYGGPRNGRISVLRPQGASPALVDTTLVLIDDKGQALRLTEAQPMGRGARAQRVEDPFQGPGAELAAAYRFPQGGAADIVLQAWDDGAVTIRVSSLDVPVRTVQYLDARTGALALVGPVRYIADRSHLYVGRVRPDGHVRRVALEATKPALVWSDDSQSGLLLAFYGYFDGPVWLSMVQETGSPVPGIGIQIDAGAAGVHRSDKLPGLSIQPMSGPIGGETFARFRRITTARYPPSLPPGRTRYQWGTWYVWGPGVHAGGLLREMDLLDQHFGDLKGWRILLDAGWYLGWGQPAAEIGAVDYSRFPEGIHPLVQAAHARGLDVTLYLGAGFVHDSLAAGGEWLALRKLIDERAGWLLPFQPEPSPIRRFLLDYARPEVQGYIKGVVRDYFRAYGADGVFVDGLADAEGQLIPRAERDSPNGPLRPLLPALEVYRLVAEEARRHRPDPYLEGGWVSPTAARPYIHAFRYGDEIDRVDHPYPFGGLLQHIDYALFARLALDQRPYLGTATGDPKLPETRWWIQAAAALGLDASLSFSLGPLRPSEVAAYRADLLLVDPSGGRTTYGPGLFPSVFATSRGGLVALGIVNRQHQGALVPLDLAILGLDGDAPYTVLDPTVKGGRRVKGTFDLELPARSFRLLVMRATPGVLWTSSVTEQQLTDGGRGLGLVARGPKHVPGFAYLATPPPGEVRLDGVAIALAPSLGEAEQLPGTYFYDHESGLMYVGYSHQEQRRIEVRW